MNPIVVFFVIAFGVPWLGWSLVHYLGDSITSTQRLMLFYTGNFCSVAGIVATYVDTGWSGVRKLWARCIQLRAPIAWYLFIFLVPLGVTLFAIHAWGLIGDAPGRPNAFALMSLFTPALMLNLTTGPLGEELGWRGFLLPKLLDRFSALNASIIIGVLWGIWHYPLYANSYFGSVGSAALFTTSTICYSILMTLVLKHTRYSIFFAVVFHWFFNKIPVAALNMYEGSTGDQMSWQLTLAYAVVAIIVVAIFGENLKREPGAKARDAL